MGGLMDNDVTDTPMEVPKARPARIAIVGRPNVGKSTLFNRMAGKKLAIVNDTPGVTRDRRDMRVRVRGHEIELMDTAGFENARGEKLEARMRAQTEAAITACDICIFVYDCLLYTSPSPRDQRGSRMPSSA